MKTFSLQEYRMQHPQTAAFPTLSQNRDLAVLLGRVNRKREARERRAAWWKMARATTAEWLLCLWSEATHTRTPAPRYASAPPSMLVAPHGRIRVRPGAGAGMRRGVPAHAHA